MFPGVSLPFPPLRKRRSGRFGRLDVAVMQSNPRFYTAWTQSRHAHLVIRSLQFPVIYTESSVRYARHSAVMQISFFVQKPLASKFAITL